ncbi:xylose isomerase, partial [Zea mays]|uniref:xylose isomerase n=1 Tax=Zea mays TaxID=4577 RepID=UPI0009AA38CA
MIEDGATVLTDTRAIPILLMDVKILTSASCQIFTHVMEPASLCLGHTDAYQRKPSGAFQCCSPEVKVYAYSAAQVKKALEVTHYLGGENYVFWGGREGYQSLLNTDMNRELDHLANFLQADVDYKKKIGFNGTLLIEPKPHDPTKHQYATYF